MTERDIQAAIRLALGQRTDVAVWRNNVGLAERDGRLVRYGLLEGSADLVGLVRMPDGVGRFFSLEVKTARGRLTPAQVAWANVVRGYGGFAAVVRSAEDALAAVDRCQRGASE